MARSSKSKLPRGATRQAHAGGETISISADPVARVRGRVQIMPSRTHGAHKDRRYERRRGAEQTRAAVRHREFD